MKNKSKQNRSQPLELGCTLSVTDVTKSIMGWKMTLFQKQEITSDPIVEFPLPFRLTISKTNFDSIQPSDQIRFLAVVTRPRKVKEKPEKEFSDLPSIIPAQAQV